MIQKKYLVIFKGSKGSHCDQSVMSKGSIGADGSRDPGGA